MSTAGEAIMYIWLGVCTWSWLDYIWKREWQNSKPRETFSITVHDVMVGEGTIDITYSETRRIEDV